MSTHQLTLFYDGRCALCMREIIQLMQLDAAGRICFEDIHADDFADRYPDIDPVEADRRLHGKLNNGTMIYGLDVTVSAWQLVNKHRWLVILRWPVIKHGADIGYRLFARYRHSISRWFKHPDACGCQVRRD
ncbi:putative thiol-disulfide oxidoreductase DCC [Methylophaga lonarensis MPL]|uniref:Putative thiol-disulfide oxidoreductase DCC n=1 Tax=Methylophaga lonarensis MPL TaxID=1286106 RepID=M7PHP3_9GAMM|nr:DUF393 domain-containing protein [Methylophaga lonarensis]EMR13405.1 putative thiol-disulfide oxidoreductase DCC [Methylophaga lonarensis MPL]